MALSLRTGRLGPMVSPETAATVELSDLDRSVLDQLPGTQYAGTADEVVAGLDALVERTGAQELILAGTVHDPHTRTELAVPLHFGDQNVGVLYAAMNQTDYQNARACGGHVRVTGPDGTTIQINFSDRSLYAGS